MNGLWRVSVRKDFSAGHALRNYNGKCENLHGHNFMVEVCVEGFSLDPATGMLLDFGILKKFLGQVLEGLDHCVLNNTPPFDAINPSSENLAAYIWRQMEELLETDDGGRKVRVFSVSVSEKGSQTATCLAPPAY